MKVTRFLVSLAFLAFASSSAFAQGTISLAWDTCAPGAVNKAILPGTVASAYASVIGHSTPHSGYQVWMLLGSPGGVRDAWRFDPAGCQGSSFITIDHLPPAAVAKSCPAFMQTAAGVQIKDYSYDALTGKAQAVMANGYAGGVAVSNPATRYFLAGFRFDHTFSVNGPGVQLETCGGLENPVCVHITRQSWIQLNDGSEHQWTVGQEFLLANDTANVTGCPGATPATPTTWGSLKNTYRN